VTAAANFSPMSNKAAGAGGSSKEGDFTAVHRYHVESKTTVELIHGLLGHVEATFYAGDVTPKSESEEVALQQLVDSGLANIKES